MSLDAQNLLQNILVPDPASRCSLLYIVHHKWLENCFVFVYISVNLKNGPLPMSNKANQKRPLSMLLKNSKMVGENINDQLMSCIPKFSPNYDSLSKRTALFRRMGILIEIDL